MKACGLTLVKNPLSPSFLLKTKLLHQHRLLAQVRAVSLGFRTGIKTSRTLYSHMRNKVDNFLHFCMQKSAAQSLVPHWFRQVYASDFSFVQLVGFF